MQNELRNIKKKIKTPDGKRKYWQLNPKAYTRPEEKITEWYRFCYVLSSSETGQEKDKFSLQYSEGYIV